MNAPRAAAVPRARAAVPVPTLADGAMPVPDLAAGAMLGPTLADGAVPDVRLRRFTLPNGLRVLLAPEHTGSCVGVAVHYRVGFRSDPPGHSGLAHLLEHLMFQRADRADHAHAVELAGGYRNAATGPDATDFHQVGPAGSLESMLAGEADRMRGTGIDGQALRTEKNVVAEEIRRNITSRPYGGFPKFALPRLLYRTFANAHDGYGDAAGLARTTIEQCRDFFAQHYAPGNALLTVVGAFDTSTARRLVAGYFGAVPAGATAVPPHLHEPEPDTELHGRHADPLAPLPATSIGYRLPDPAADLPGYVAHVLLAAVLEVRLRHRLVLEQRAAVAVTAACGLIGGPFEACHPQTLACTITQSAGADQRRAIAAVDAELSALASGGPTGEELLVTTRRWVSGQLRRHDSLHTRLRSLGTFELLHGDAALHTRVSRLALATDVADIARAAQRLLAAGRAVLSLSPRG
ncbi:M16 family metallopeptidase, partial [Streptomyces sp. NPDC004752]